MSNTNITVGPPTPNPENKPLGFDPLLPPQAPIELPEYEIVDLGKKVIAMAEDYTIASGDVERDRVIKDAEQTATVGAVEYGTDAVTTDILEVDAVGEGLKPHEQTSPIGDLIALEASDHLARQK